MKTSPKEYYRQIKAITRATGSVAFVMGSRIMLEEGDLPKVTEMLWRGELVFQWVDHGDQIVAWAACPLGSCVISNGELFDTLADWEA